MSTLYDADDDDFAGTSKEAPVTAETSAAVSEGNDCLETSAAVSEGNDCLMIDEEEPKLNVVEDKPACAGERPSDRD